MALIVHRIDRTEHECGLQGRDARGLAATFSDELVSACFSQRMRTPTNGALLSPAARSPRAAYVACHTQYVSVITEFDVLPIGRGVGHFGGQPSARRRAAVLEPGTPFLFKLHAPLNVIVGGGFFVRYSPLPARLAWEAFGADNGVADYESLRRRVERYRSAPVVGEPEIGCNILNDLFFLPEANWIPVPDNWAPNIVQGKGYSTAEPAGSRLWALVRDRIRPVDMNVLQDERRFGADYLTRARLGQGAFRVLVTDAYQRRCAITGERTLPVLEAAHIQPFAEDGPHQVANGLLLRSDLHKLFDRGYLTVNEDFRVEVSRRIREEFANGREYYRHHGQQLAVSPLSQVERPSAAFLRWHNEHRFLS